MYNTDSFLGHIYAAISVVLGTAYLVTWDTVEHVIRLLIAVGSLITAFMAIRNYYFKTKLSKKLLAEDKEIKEEDLDE